MMSKWFAVGAALLAALFPFAARADVLHLFGSDGFVTVTSPTSFSVSASGLTGVACWYFNGTCGTYSFLSTSVTALPATLSLVVDIYSGNSSAQLNGTVDLTGVEGYPASPEFIGTFTVGGVFSVPGNPGPPVPRRRDVCCGFPGGFRRADNAIVGGAGPAIFRPVSFSTTVLFALR
jgi:hypothetical protein